MIQIAGLLADLVTDQVCDLDSVVEFGLSEARTARLPTGIFANNMAQVRHSSETFSSENYRLTVWHYDFSYGFGSENLELVLDL